MYRRVEARGNPQEDWSPGADFECEASADARKFDDDGRIGPDKTCDDASGGQFRLSGLIKHCR